MCTLPCTAVFGGSTGPVVISPSANGCFLLMCYLFPLRAREIIARGLLCAINGGEGGRGERGEAFLPFSSPQTYFFDKEATAVQSQRRGLRS